METPNMETPSYRGRFHTWLRKKVRERTTEEQRKDLIFYFYKDENAFHVACENADRTLSHGFEQLGKPGGLADKIENASKMIERVTGWFSKSKSI